MKLFKVKIQKLESEKAMFQIQIEELRELSTKYQDENEELESYLRIDGLSNEKDETSEDVLRKVT